MNKQRLMELAGVPKDEVQSMQQLNENDDLETITRMVGNYVATQTLGWLHSEDGRNMAQDVGDNPESMDDFLAEVTGEQLNAIYDDMFKDAFAIVKNNYSK